MQVNKRPKTGGALPLRGGLLLLAGFVFGCIITTLVIHEHVLSDPIRPPTAPVVTNLAPPLTPDQSTHVEVNEVALSTKDQVEELARGMAEKMVASLKTEMKSEADASLEQEKARLKEEFQQGAKANQALMTGKKIVKTLDKNEQADMQPLMGSKLTTGLESTPGWLKQVDFQKEDPSGTNRWKNRQKTFDDLELSDEAMEQVTCVFVYLFFFTNFVYA